MMRALRLQYVLILGSMLGLAVLWEFVVEETPLFAVLTGFPAESLATKLEYIVTVGVFCALSLLYPYYRARKEAHIRLQNTLEREQLIAQLQDSLAEIKTLRGILPICAYCQKIRNDQDVWMSLEAYLHTHADARLSHGICPECLAQEMKKINT